MKKEKWNPHTYQLTASRFILSNKRAGLFLDPGLGKTAISLSVMKTLKNTKGSKATLLVAPLRVCHSVWPKEIEKWENFEDLTYTILHKGGKKSLWGEQKDIYLINPEGLKWLYRELFAGLTAGKDCPFDILWVDESTKFKNPLARSRFLLLREMLPLFNRVCIMTGTPCPKTLIDLWSQIYLLDRGATLNPNFYLFRNTYFESHGYKKYEWKLKDFSADRIQEAISPLVLDMSIDDYLEMPELQYNNIMIDLPSDKMAYYKEMENDMFIRIDSLEASANAQAQATMKCHQIANGSVYEDVPEGLDDDEMKLFKRTRRVIHVHDEKIQALADLIDELNGKPLLIAYHYKHDLEALRKLLGKDVPYIGSGVSTGESDRLVDKWNRGELPILCGHPVSMGHGLNMQAVGRNVCWYSLTWNLEDYMQLIIK